MATNPPSGDGHRNGAVRKRSQVFNPKTEQWVKRDKDTGRFIDVKQDGTPFKGVTKEKYFFTRARNDDTCPLLFTLAHYCPVKVD